LVNASVVPAWRNALGIVVIALMLGHESPSTTHHYIELDMQMKERCLRKLKSPKTKTVRFKPSDRLLAFLESL
jgi:integrase/recombinase XerD